MDLSLRKEQFSYDYRYCGYWVSLKGQPETDNTTSKTIHIPRQQVFSVDALREIMRRIAARQDL